MKNIDAVIIGAGACGLMTAVQAGYLGKKVIVLEKREIAGAKILISGGGRCNYTNLHTTEENFICENEHFLKSIFAQWSVQDTLTFFESNGIQGEEKTLGQLFPANNRARSVVNVFLDLCRDLRQEILYSVAEIKIKKLEQGFQVDFSTDGKSQSIHTNKVVVAAGGLPIPKMGASDFGLQVARQFDLNVIKTAAALVPLTISSTERAFYEGLSGTSIFCRVYNDRISFEENILFTYWGLSGPAILQISSYWKQGEKIFIDLLPNHSLLKLLKVDRDANGKKILKNYLEQFFTKKFVESLSALLPTDLKLASLSNAHIEQIDKLIHRFEVLPAGDKGYEKAEVMRGGVSTDELNAKTLESKKVTGLYFGGECVDVTGWLGGYNFQWAWAAGYVIAQDL